MIREGFLDLIAGSDEYVMISDMSVVTGFQGRASALQRAVYHALNAGQGTFLEVEFSHDIVEAMQSGDLSLELKHRLLNSIRAAAMRYVPQYSRAHELGEEDIHRFVTLRQPWPSALHSPLSVPETSSSEEAAVEKKLAAGDALDNIIQPLQQNDNWDERYGVILQMLPGFLRQYGTDAMFEIQHAVLGERYPPDIRADVLEAIVRLDLVDDASAVYREWIAFQALKSPSHFVRDGAITAWNVLGGQADRLREAAAREPVKRLKDRMEKVASALEARLGGAAIS